MNEVPQEAFKDLNMMERNAAATILQLLLLEKAHFKKKDEEIVAEAYLNGISSIITVLRGMPFLTPTNLENAFLGVGKALGYKHDFLVVGVPSPSQKMDN